MAGFVFGLFIFIAMFGLTARHWDFEMNRNLYAVAPANSGEPYIFCEKLTALSGAGYFDCETKAVAGFQHIVLRFDENTFTEKAKRCLIDE